MARSVYPVGPAYDCFRKSHEVDGSVVGAQTDYQVSVVVHRNTGMDSGNDVYVGSKSEEDFGDIRFTKSDGETELDYWLEEQEVGAWSKYAGNPILSPEGTEDHIAFASVLKVSDTYHMYYVYHDGSDVDQIGHATSDDGKNWTKDAANNPVLVSGAGGAWDDFGVWCPMVWKEGDTWYMLYTGQTDTVPSVKKIGLATSGNGVSWDKSASNPVLVGSNAWELREGLSIVENWGIMKVDTTYYLWYGVLGVIPRQVGLATSTDLINWSKDASNPLFSGVKGRFCAFPFKRGIYYYLLVNHYDSATWTSPVELYRDRSPTFYVDERQYLGIAIEREASGWDSHHLDTPCVLTDDINRDSFTASGDQLWCYYTGLETYPGVLYKTGMTIETDIDTALTPPSATFWVEVDSIPASPDSATIYMYYGKAGSTTTSNGENTFPEFDDFNSDTGADYENKVGGITLTIVGGRASVQGTTAGWNIKCRKIFSQKNLAWDIRLEYASPLAIAGYESSPCTIRLTGSGRYSTETDTDTDPDSTKITQYYAPVSYLTGDLLGDITIVTLAGHETSIIFFLDYTEIGRGVGAAGGNITGQVGFGAFGTAVLSGMMWTHARNFCDPEPTHGVWGAEEPAIWIFG